MIKFLLQTTTLSLLFLSPAFCMDPPPDGSKIGKLSRKLSRYSLLEGKQSSIEKKTTTKNPLKAKAIHYHEQASYYQGKAISCLGKESYCNAEIAAQRYWKLKPRRKRGSVETVGEDTRSPEAIVAFQEWKKNLKEAAAFFEKATELGYVEAQYSLAIVLGELSEIDSEYAGDKIQQRIKTLKKADSDKAATLHFIGVRKAPQPSQSILEESDKSTKDKVKVNAHSGK